MKLVVGLGNPGRRYEGTRHNIGYAVLAELARKLGVGARPKGKISGGGGRGRPKRAENTAAEPDDLYESQWRSVQEAKSFYKLAERRLAGHL